MARWARHKKSERKSRSECDQNTKNQKTKMWDKQNKNVCYREEKVQISFQLVLLLIPHNELP